MRKTYNRSEFEEENEHLLPGHTLNALWHAELASYEALRNASFDDVSGVPLLGVGRLARLVQVLKDAGIEDMPWIEEYDRRVKNGIKIIEYRRPLRKKGSKNNEDQ